MFHGQGIYNYANGCKYEGYYVNNLRHGPGIEIMIDIYNIKSTYTGDYYKD